MTNRYEKKKYRYPLFSRKRVFNEWSCETHGQRRPRCIAERALSGSPQSIPQYVEVPPNIEAKRIISYFSAVLSYQSNPLLLNDESKLMIFLRLLAGHLLLHFHDPSHHTNEGPF
jgi:hypothetical protein